MLNLPPRTPTTLSPTEIIGVEMADPFLKHFRIINGQLDGFPENRVKKEIGDEHRSMIAGIYRELRAHGFYPVGLNDFGQIRWKTALADRVHMALQKDLKENPFTDIETEKKKARGDFCHIGEQIPLAA